MPLSVLIADDHELFRSGLKQLLIDALGATEVREAETLDQAVERLTNEGAADLILVDLRMPGMSGAEALAALRDGFPSAKLAVVSASEDRNEILSSLAAGAHGFVPKSLGSNEIADALRAVLEGQIFAPVALARREPSEPGQKAVCGEGLTARQREVLSALVKGRSSKEIARALSIAEGTVKIHLAAIYRSLDVRTRAEAIAKLSGR